MTTVQEALRIVISSDLASHFEALATINGRTVEEEIVLHLTRTKTFNSANPMYFDDERTAALTRLLGVAVTTPDKVIDMIRRLVTQRIGAYKVQLSPARQEAAYWWIRNSGMSEADALAMLWDQALGLLLKC